MSAAAGEKTEKATPKRRDDARKKGQVAKSADLNGAAVLAAALVGLAAFGPNMAGRMESAMRETFALIATPDVVGRQGLATLLGGTGETVAAAAGPIALVCLVAGVAANVVQVGFRPAAQAVKPDPKRLSPLQGFKRIFGVQALFEGAKNLTKVAIVGGIAALAVFPELPVLAALVGIPAGELAAKLADSVFDVATRAAVAYLVIAIADMAWQRHRHEKQLRMTKDEVKREQKEYAVSPELRAAIRRRQMQATKARMMAAVPGADVVVTNPTHFSVALSYDGSRPAPVVVAKGQDLVALEIRRVAEEHGVPVVPDPPLARSLHGSVELGHEIPEELYQAVAQLLAFVYRLAGRSVAA